MAEASVTVLNLSNLQILEKQGDQWTRNATYNIVRNFWNQDRMLNVLPTKRVGI